MFSSSAISNSYETTDGQIMYKPSNAPRARTSGGSTMYNDGMPMYSAKPGREEPNSVYFSKPGIIEVVLPPAESSKKSADDKKQIPPPEDDEEDEEEEGEEEDELEDE